MSQNAPLWFFLFFPRLISLYTRKDLKVCIFFTIVLAMTSDELSATRQIHQEEQALEIKGAMLLEFREHISPTIKQTPHKLCGDDRELTLPFSRWFPFSLPILLNECFPSLFSFFF